jgi:hypothetical protein
MIFYDKKTEIRYLNLPNLHAFCNYKCRYNCVTDIVNKGYDQIQIFLARANEIYLGYLRSRISNFDSASSNSNIKLNIYLSVVFCKVDTDINDEDFPIAEFLSFDVIKNGDITSSGFGVMLSTYLHDLDRLKIESYSVANADLSLSSLFWKSLFESTILNENKPPFKYKYPIFVFPKNKSPIDVFSATDRYMEHLGMRKLTEYSLEGIPMRVYHPKPDLHIQSSEVYLAFLAIGQVLLEMTNPEFYQSNSQLSPFNRNNFTDEVKNKQKDLFVNWLLKHNLFENKN